MQLLCSRGVLKTVNKHNYSVEYEELEHLPNFLLIVLKRKNLKN